MEFHQFAEREVGTVVQDLVRRLQDAADAELRQVRRELEADLETIRRQADTLREELETESARAATLEADLDSVIEAHRTVDGARLKAEAALAEQARARAATEEELGVVRELLDGARGEHVRLQEALEAEAALKALLESDLTSSRDALDRAESRLRTLEGSVQSLEATVATLEAELIEAREAAEAGVRQAQEDAEARVRETRVAAEAALRDAQEAAEATRRQLREDAAAELGEARASAEALIGELRAAGDRAASELQLRDEAIDRLEADLAASRATELSVRAAVDEARGVSLRLHAEAEAEAARLAEALARAEAAEAAARRTENELRVLREEVDPGEVMLQASIRALESLAAATSVAALMAGLARQLAPHFARVAIFRVKGHHLEGEQGAGLDPTIDLTKLSIPAGPDSAISRAAATRAIQDLDLLALAEEPTAFGGSPGAALAVPIVFQGDTFAVAYVDRDDAIEPAHRAYAALLAGQAGVLLGRLSQELKLMKELRDYAALLVQEAEQMFVADLENGRPEAERRRRLAETIECARQLFAQRAALEGPAAARALDDYLLEVMTAPTESSFAAELAVVVADGVTAR